MKPITFKEARFTMVENQPEYLSLPVFRSIDGEVVSCWKMSIWERIFILFTGRIWWRQLTFNQKLQPQLPEVKKPFRKIGKNKFAIRCPVVGGGR